jgi:nucleoside-diphosphate-sugar epimerase
MAIMNTRPSSPDGSRLPCAPDAVDDFLSAPDDGAIAALRRAEGPFAVLGAGGKMGLHLSVMLRRALDRLGRSDPVIAISRFTTLRDQAEFQARGVETIACDLSDRAALAALPDAKSIFFLAGVKFGTANSPELLERMNVVMPRLVADRFRGSRIVAFSTGCVYPFVRPETGGATEEMAPDPPGEYARSCLARETAFADVSARHGTPVVLLRLNYSVEFRYGVLLDIAQKVQAGAPVDVSTGFVNVIWQRDAVAQTIQTLGLAQTPAVPINLTGPDIFSVRELARAFGKYFGREPVIEGVEADSAWLNNAAKSHRLFGRPETSLSTMVQWVGAWVQQAGASWGKPTGFEKRDGKF